MRPDPIREKAVSLLREMSRSSIELAWVMAGIFVEQNYRSWGFSTFHEWLRNDAGRCCSISWAYKLARAGCHLSPHRRRIDELAGQGKVGINDIIRIGDMIDGGANPAEMVELLEKGCEIKQIEAKAVSKIRDSEEPVRQTFWVPAGDRQMVEIGITLFCIRNQCRTHNEALRMWAISEFNDPYVPKEFQRFRDFIFQGKFFCRLCGKVPLQPNLHHVVPRSILGGDMGPVELLCEDPCHVVVQKDWRKYARLWKHDVEKIVESCQKK